MINRLSATILATICHTPEIFYHIVKLTFGIIQFFMHSTDSILSQRITESNFQITKLDTVRNSPICLQWYENQFAF